MSAAERLEYIEAIVRYGLTGKRKAMSHYVRGRMVAVMRDVDAEIKREDAFIARQRLNGRKKWHKEEMSTSTDAKPATACQPMPNLPRHAMAENPHNKETRVPAHSHAYTDGVSIPLRSIDTSIVDVVVSGLAAANNDNNDVFSVLIDKWNAAVKASHSKMRTIRTIAPGSKRHRDVEEILRLYGVRDVLDAIEAAAASEYINGRNNLGWVATFDWFVQPDNFAKVLEGNFRELRAAQPATTKPASAPKPAPPPQLPAPPASSEDKEAFVRVKERLRRTQGEAFVRKWLDCCRLWVRDGNRVSIACPSGYVAEELRQKHAGAILQAARAEWGKSTDVWLDVVRGIETTETE